MRTIIILFAFTLLLSDCANTTVEETTAPATTGAAKSPPVAVQAMPVEQGTFPLKMTTNGRLHAARKLELKLEVGGRIAQLFLKAGGRVQQGQVLLQLEDGSKQLQLEAAQLALEEAEVNKADLLIANGGLAYVDTSVSAEKLALIHTLSGYNKAQHAIKQATYELSKSKIHAPFNALVAEVQVQAQQQVSAGETICTLIDPNSFEAVFTLLEKDALGTRLSERVRIRPMAAPDMVVEASISAIDPVVNEQGLVSIYAKLKAKRSLSLFEGMNVQVDIERPIAKQLIVPKSAVVLRSGRSVVFTYENGLAKWHYVTLAHENDQAVAISEGLSRGDTVIYKGNLNLDHDGEVILAQQ
ncbi:MAG: efflux RND transporter periplasmic adaptor subunit [Bacteroidota bacterium]